MQLMNSQLLWCRLIASFIQEPLWAQARRLRYRAYRLVPNPRGPVKKLKP